MNKKQRKKRLKKFKEMNKEARRIRVFTRRAKLINLLLPAEPSIEWRYCNDCIFYYSLRYNKNLMLCCYNNIRLSEHETKYCRYFKKK